MPNRTTCFLIMTRMRSDMDIFKRFILCFASNSQIDFRILVIVLWIDKFKWLNHVEFAIRIKYTFLNILQFKQSSVETLLSLFFDLAKKFFKPIQLCQQVVLI